MVFKGKWYKLIFILGVFLLLANLYACNEKTELPTDEEMIKHFYENRSDIEILVSRYRTYDPGPKKSHDDWMTIADTPLIMKKAKVFRIEYSPLDPWAPNPYSLETAKQQEQVIFKKNTTIPISVPFSFYKQGMLWIEFSPRERYREPRLLTGVVSKTLVFIPEVPKIEDGYLLGPLRTNGEYSFKIKIVESTDFIPSWSKYNKFYKCVFKQIEPQWFLELCGSRRTRH